MTPQKAAESMPLVDGADASADITHAYDAVIVGSGAGGAVLAKELAEGGMRVAIVEEGARHEVHRDLPFESIGRMYRDYGFSATIGRPPVLTPAGKCFGGTTTINSGTCFRTPESVIARWNEEFGLRAIVSENLARILDRVERELNVIETPLELMSAGNRKIHELLEQKGLRGEPLRRNVRGCEGCGTCCYGCTSGAKQSMDRTYLPKALQAGAAAYTNTRAQAVLVDRSGRAEGVAARTTSGKRVTLRAPIVAVACGTLFSPALLKQSGVARHNAHLGRHLTLHPATKVYAQFNDHIDDWRGVPQSYSYSGLHDDGIKFEGASMPPDLGCMAAPFSGPRLARFILDYTHMASFGFMISDTAEGRMFMVPGLGPVYHYTMTATDLRRIRKGIAFLARLYLEGGATAVHPLVNTEGRDLRSLADVDRFEQAPLRARNLEMMAFHPLGTCRMALSPEQGVCDQDHQVFGYRGVYVCDGSVVPTVLGVNPQVTIMGLATRLAELLLGTTLA